MFESPPPAAALDLPALAARLAQLSVAGDDGDRVDQLDELERLKAAVCATQARIAVELDTTRSDASLGAQVGLARHESPHRGRSLLGLARALRDLPETFAALERGDINEHRAEIVVTESRDLSRSDRGLLDARIAEDLPRLGNRKLQLLARRIMLRLDPDGATARRERAHARRSVTSRRLPDGMAMITGVVSDIHHAAIMGSLNTAVKAEMAAGDDRTRSQILTDLFVARLTGQVTAKKVPVNINLVLSAETLLGADDEPADIVGEGPIPASVARGLVGASPEHLTRIRRLFRFADTDRLIAMESTSRAFDGLLAEFIRIRDQVCRTPWCNAPIRQLDHAVPVAEGGPTTEGNGQGLCESCNYTKEEPGWESCCVSGPFDTHVVVITTPTGHLHRSRSPGMFGHQHPPGRQPGRQPSSRMEIYLTDLPLIA